MTRLGEDWLKQIQEQRAAVVPLIPVYREVGAVLESRAIQKVALQAERYLQGLDQIAAILDKLGDLSDALRARAWRQDPREDPESIKVSEAIDKTLRELAKVSDKLDSMSISWTLEESIGSNTGLWDHLEYNASFPAMEEVIEFDLDETLEELLDEVTRRSYDFRPSRHRKLPSLREKSLRKKR